MRFMFMALLSAVIMGTGCTKDPEMNPADDPSEDALLKTSIVLTDAEIESLMYMVEEEKLAMDVYDYLYGIYQSKIFDKISASEEKHVAAMSKFFTKYELTNPIIGNAPGFFVNPDLQELYYNLIEQAEESHVQAMTVGIIIETQDLQDIQYYLDNVLEAKDLTQAYTHLLEGSLKHLAAFEGELE